MKKTNLVTFTSLALICICAAALSAATITVDVNGSTTYTTIQSAIDDSSNGDIILVLPGTYYESINFNGLAITVTSMDPDELGYVYGTVINGQTAASTVTFAGSEVNSSVLTGITIENGNTGISCNNSTPRIEKCVISKSNGDGISNCDGQIRNCVIEDSAARGISNSDGVILNSDIMSNGSNGLYRCNGEISGCSVVGNASHGINECDGRVKNSTIQANNGSGIYFADGTEISNCVISGNKSYGIGYIYGTVENCTIVGNVSQGIVTTTLTSYQTVDVSNNIIVKNGAFGIRKNRSSTVVTLKNNNIWDNTSGSYDGLTAGGTDISVDPLFALDGSWDGGDNWTEGDYHLLSEAGRWLDDIWVLDDVSSPCIDAGDPASMFFLEPEPNGGIINQGAYGGTLEASKTPSDDEYDCTEAIPGDVNGDCKVDLKDLAVICLHWLECNREPASACLP
ncbi:MAG: right-handed parallel beta-helix repeat-containing protein [Phycisphaerae bacterium]|nr:right-handed parallel beta-helix repeat-containing protein [Phycisphaerae bacterium]